MSRTIKAIERHMISKSSRIAHQSDSDKPTATRQTGLQNESGGNYGFNCRLFASAQ